MTVGQLLTSLSLTNAAGTDIPLISATRSIQTASGLAGIAAREVVVARSGRRGSRNLTRYRDDAQIVITGTLMGVDATDTWAQYDAVGGALADAVDTDRLLKWTAGSGLALQRNVRLTSFDAPLSVGADVITYQATLRGSDPNVYGQIEKSASAVPLGSTTGGGLVFPMVFPVVFNPPATATAGFTNAGFISAPPVFTLQGYLKNPVIELTPGVSLVFDGEIAGSDTLTVDVDARTVLLNGTDNRRYLLDSVNSTWFELPPGSGTVTLVAEDFTPGAGLTVTWRDARD